MLLEFYCFGCFIVRILSLFFSIYLLFFFIIIIQLNFHFSTSTYQFFLLHKLTTSQKYHCVIFTTRKCIFGFLSRSISFGRDLLEFVDYNASYFHFLYYCGPFFHPSLLPERLFCMRNFCWCCCLKTAHCIVNKDAKALTFILLLGIYKLVLIRFGQFKRCTSTQSNIPHVIETLQHICVQALVHYFLFKYIIFVLDTLENHVKLGHICFICFDNVLYGSQFWIILISFDVWVRIT